jgi:uncharacterized protein YmfQ (DUF2313 family)
MSHRDVIKLLLPLELTGVSDADIALEGQVLDDVEAQAKELLGEMFPDRSVRCLTDWERVCALVPAADATLQSRRDNVVRKLRERGGLSRKYFIALAVAMGYTITIDELQPFMAGWSRAGDPLYEEEVRFIWRVRVSGQALYYFRAGLSTAGERLLWWPSVTALEDLFNSLKPAHTYIIFDYS